MSGRSKRAARGWSHLCRRVTALARRHSVGFRARGRDPEQARPVHLSGGTPYRTVPPHRPCPSAAQHRAPKTPGPRRVQRKRLLYQPTPPSADDGRAAFGAPTPVWKASAGPPLRAMDTGMPEPRFPSGTRHTSGAAEHRRKPTPEQEPKDTSPSLSRDRDPVPPTEPVRRPQTQTQTQTQTRQGRTPPPTANRPARPPSPVPARETQPPPRPIAARPCFPLRTRSSSASRSRVSPFPRTKGS